MSFSPIFTTTLQSWFMFCPFPPRIVPRDSFVSQRMTRGFLSRQQSMNHSRRKSYPVIQDASPTSFNGRGGLWQRDVNIVFKIFGTRCTRISEPVTLFIVCCYSYLVSFLCDIHQRSALLMKKGSESLFLKVPNSYAQWCVK